MTKKNILFLIAGMAIGTASGIFGTRTFYKKKYEKIADEEVAEMSEYYEKKAEYDRPEVTVEEDEKDIPDRAKGMLDPSKRREIKNALDKNWEETTNYAAAYKRKTDPVDPEGREEDTEEPNEEDIMTPEEEADDIHERNRNKPPKIISIEEAGALPAWVEQETLYFYSYDEVLADENHEEITDIERLIGDALTKYDFIDSDEKVIFVMNWAIDTCFEIQKVQASYDDEVYS